MTNVSVHRERFEIHAAVCRARKQDLCCSTCSELLERAERAAAAQQIVRAA